MEKAFDLADLVVRLKGHGLPVAEELAKAVVASVLDWTNESVLLTPNKFDDFAAAVIPLIKPLIMKELEKIDGK